MIQKFTLGSPFTSDSVVVQLEAETTPIPFLSFDTHGFSYSLSDNDIVCGLGEAVRGINKRGWKYSSYNLDNSHHQEDTLSLYGAHNFLLISGKHLFGVFFDYPGRMDYDIGYTDRSRLTISAADYNLDLYIITGEKEMDIIKQLRKLTGQSYIAPKWAFGYGQSRWGYKTAEDIYEVYHLHKEHDIPLDMIYLDIDYMQNFKDFTIDDTAFPDFKSFCEKLLSDGLHLIPIIDAGVKMEKGYEVYEEGVKNNFFCKDADGKDFVAAVWPGRVHFPDMLNEEARTWFGNKYSVLLDCGIEGFWNDMNEPSIFYTEKRLEKTVSHIVELGKKNIGLYDYFDLTGSINSLSHNPEDHKEFYHNVHGEMIRHDKVHNLYGGLMTKAAAEAFTRLRPGKRTLMFSRSSYIGAHRYGGIWQGDNKAWWSHLLMNIQMTASLNMTGFLYTGADLGGFGSDTTEDLMLRWLQFSMFTPLMRNHSAMHTRQRELYRFKNMVACRNMIRIRYGLIPYLYSEYMKAVLSDGMMIRPIWFDYPDEISRGVEDQVLLGDELMLTPVYTQNAKGRYVYLPEEMMMVSMKTLEDITTKIYPAGHHYISIALEELVFFIRRGKAIPLGAGGPNVASLSTTLTKLGYENSTYLLYEDDGNTTNVSNQNYHTI